MIDTSQFKKGLKIEVDGEVYEIVDYSFLKVAQRQATVKTKLRNIFTGNIITKTFVSYKDGDNLVFMVKNLKCLKLKRRMPNFSTKTETIWYLWI